MKRVLVVLVLVSAMLSFAGCNKAVKVERHVEKTKITDGDVTESYQKDEGTIYNKDFVSLKLEDYGLEYINVNVKSTIDLNSSDAYICFCPSNMDFDTNRNAYDCAVIRKEITEQTESFTLDLTDVKKGEYYIVVVSDLKNEDGMSYVFNLFALR